MKNSGKNSLDNLEAMLTFLERTKDGDYVEINKEFTDNSRTSISRDEYITDEQYFYSIT